MNNQDYLFTIAHQLKNRIRIIVPSLHSDKERAMVFKILLLKREAINEIKIIPTINSITIYFDSEQLAVENLLTLLNAILANFPKKPRDTIKASQENDLDIKEQQDVVFGVKGMSCESCALFLEMVLSKQTQKEYVSVNYQSERGAVRSNLSKAEIFTIIENNGYQPYSLDVEMERQLLQTYQDKTTFFNWRLLWVGIPFLSSFFIKE